MKIEQGASAPKRPSGNGKNNKPVFIIAGVVVVVALVIAGIFIVKNMNGGGSGSGKEDPSSVENPSSVEQTSSEEENLFPVEPDEFDPELGILAKFVDKYTINSDFIGHLTIPNTLLDTDIVKGADNAYYLDHTLEKKSNVYGIPFADHRSIFTMGYQSPIVTIHGHNSKNGDFFESVKDYSDIEYYKANPIMNFDTIYGSGVYKIIGRYTTYILGDDFYPYHDKVNLEEPDFDIYMKDLESKNYYNSGIDVKFGDNLLVLSTCNDAIQGPKDTPYRDILVARKVRVGEDPSVDVSKIEKNEDMVMPEGWQKKFGKVNPYK